MADSPVVQRLLALSEATSHDDPNSTDCLDCHRSKRLKARGRCSTCYEKWRSRGIENPKWKKSNYPSDSEMVELAGRMRTMAELAKHIGVRRTSLRDYLSIRPTLDTEVRRVIKFNMASTTAAVSAEAKARWAAANPEKVREYNRRWARNQDPARRAKWNFYNRQRRAFKNASYVMTDPDQEFASILRQDPCGYCLRYGKPTIDHIIPIEAGGTSEWENLTGACWSCNSSKNDSPLLLFLLRRALEKDALKEMEKSNG